jgi:hypothetical protein
MKIGIVSDTHGNVVNFKKAVSWFNAQNIKLILHAGDIGDPESLEESLQDFDGGFFGVFGNMDQDFKILVEEYNKISKGKIEENTFKTEIEGKRIAINHFSDEAKKLAQSGKFDLVFYGHTHRPWSEKIGVSVGGSCHMINPGELAGQFYKPTFAVYDTETDELELKILEKL